MEQQVWLALSITAGVVFGFLISWLNSRADRINVYTRGKSDGEKERAQLAERLASKEARIEELQNERDRERQTAERLREESASLRAAQQEMDKKVAEARAQAEEKAALVQKLAEEKLALVSDTQQKLSDTFKALSAEVLQNNNQAFLDLAKSTLEKFQDGAKTDLDSRQKAIDDVIRPLQDSLQKMDSSIVELEKNRVAAFAGLSEQANTLLAAQAQLRGETASLVNALRAPTVRGQWGEVQLRRVVELAGMIEHCDFEQQPSVETDDGTLRPDILIHLPGNRLVVVDAKVSLKAYLESLDMADEDARAGKLKEHAEQLRQHVVRLGGKKYWNQFAGAPEFAVAFLPAEAFFSAALEQDPGLIEFAAERKVILATPTTLIALLKAVSSGWQQQRLADNARQISELGQTLYDRLQVFGGYLDELRRNLHRSVESYNRAAGSFESRVLVTARRFKELGAAGGDDMPCAETVDTVPRGLRTLDQITISFPEQLPASGAADEPAPQSESTADAAANGNL